MFKVLTAVAGLGPALFKSSPLGSGPFLLLPGHRTGCGWGTPDAGALVGGVRVGLRDGRSPRDSGRASHRYPLQGPWGRKVPCMAYSLEDQVVPSQILLSLSSLQRFLQRWREAVGLKYILAPFGVQQNLLGAWRGSV